MGRGFLFEFRMKKARSVRRGFEGNHNAVKETGIRLVKQVKKAIGIGLDIDKNKARGSAAGSSGRSGYFFTSCISRLNSEVKWNLISG